MDAALPLAADDRFVTPFTPPPVKVVGRRKPSFNAAMTDKIATSGDGGQGSPAQMEDLLVLVGKTRDKAAFKQVFDYFAPRLKAYVMRLGAPDDVAEELVQEALLMVWRRAETYDPRQARASTWIFTIARNKRIDAIRKAKRPEPDVNDPSFMPEEVQPADKFVEAAQDEERVKEALKTLPEEQARLIRQVYFEDKSHRVIAAETGLPLGTVKSRIRLALKKMRLTIEDRDDASTSP